MKKLLAKSLIILVFSAVLPGAGWAAGLNGGLPAEQEARIDADADLQSQINNIKLNWHGQLPVEYRSTSFCDGDNNGTIWFDSTDGNSGMRICLGFGDIGYFSTGGLKQINGHIVFVTSGIFAGDMGGTYGADGICQSQADSGTQTAQLGLTWRALLSDSQTDLRDKLTNITSGRVIYRIQRLGEEYPEKVSSDSDGLWDNSIDAPINITQDGTKVSLTSDIVWTGTYNSGVTDTYSTCNSWDPDTNLSAALVGEANDSGVSWIFRASANCGLEFRLYCISEQPIEFEVKY